MTTRALHGWIPDAPDDRDWRYSKLRHPARRLFSSVLRPSSAYLRLDLMPPVFNQGQLGSCTGHGTGTCLDYMEAKEGHPEILSRLAIYFWARGGVPEDTGATIRDAVKSVARHGAPLESLWPYDVNRWKDCPSSQAITEGAHRGDGLEYYRIRSLDEVKDAIAQGFPVVFGTELYPGFEDVGEDGIVPMPGDGEDTIGSHCLAFIGYATKKRIAGAGPGCFFVRNSWGPAWGAQGNCWLPFDYVRKYASDFWCVRKIAR